MAEQRWTPDEIRLAATSLRAAVRDGKNDDEVGEWLRPGFLSDEVAPMLEAFARVSGESATTPAQESTNEDDNVSHMGDAVDGGARTNDGCLDDHSLTSPAPPPCEWQFVKGTVCGKPSAERLVLTPIPDKERWAESAVDLCRRHARMAREGRCEGYRSAVEVECSYEKHRPGGASPTPTDATPAIDDVLLHETYEGMTNVEALRRIGRLLHVASARRDSLGEAVSLSLITDLYNIADRLAAAPTPLSETAPTDIEKWLNAYVNLHDAWARAVAGGDEKSAERYKAHADRNKASLLAAFAGVSRSATLPDFSTADYACGSISPGLVATCEKHKDHAGDHGAFFARGPDARIFWPRSATAQEPTPDADATLGGLIDNLAGLIESFARTQSAHQISGTWWREKAEFLRRTSERLARLTREKAQLETHERALMLDLSESEAEYQRLSSQVAQLEAEVAHWKSTVGDLEMEQIEASNVLGDDPENYRSLSEHTKAVVFQLRARLAALQADAWREYAEHLEMCLGCGSNQCERAAELQEAAHSAMHGDDDTVLLDALQSLAWFQVDPLEEDDGYELTLISGINDRQFTTVGKGRTLRIAIRQWLSTLPASTLEKSRAARSTPPDVPKSENANG